MPKFNRIQILGFSIGMLLIAILGLLKLPTIVWVVVFLHAGFQFTMLINRDKIKKGLGE